jgi:hypothetical protein
MRKIFLGLLIITFCSKLHSLGKIEIPTNYLDIGKLHITNERDIYEIPLRYWKPEGVVRINKIDLRGIRINSVIIDGTQAKPINGRLFYSEIFRNDQSEEVDSIAGYYTIVMRLRMIFENQLEREIWAKEAKRKTGTGLFYETWAEKDGYLKLYWIPYGTKEVYINYSICVLKQNEVSKFDIIEANKAIKFDLEWQVEPYGYQGNAKAFVVLD